MQIVRYRKMLFLSYIHIKLFDIPPRPCHKRFLQTFDGHTIPLNNLHTELRNVSYNY